MKARSVAGTAVSILKWPVFGALLAGGAIVVARRFGPDTARELGGNAGEGFAYGVARAQDQIAELAHGVAVAGTRGLYR